MKEYRTKTHGHRIEFKVYDPDPHDKLGEEKGYTVIRIDALVAGMKAGYIKIGYIPSERWPTYYPTVWHYLERVQGWCVGIRGKGATDPVDWAELWKKVHHYAGASPASRPSISPLALSNTHVPDVETIRRDLEVLEERQEWHRESMENFKLSLVDRPYVDFIRVFKGPDPHFNLGNEGPLNFRGEDISMALYEYAARWLAEHKDMSLRASGLQSEEAKARWDQMAESAVYPIHEVTLPTKRTYRVLDYTKCPEGCHAAP